jgi:hypothetical protein
MVFAVALFSPLELAVLGVWFLAILSPIVYAARSKTSIAMGITVSVLLGAVVQVLGCRGLLGLERLCVGTRSLV